MERSTPLARRQRARTHAVKENGGDDQSAEQELHPIRIDLSEHQPILDERNDQHGEDGSDDRDIAASQRGPANNRGREGEQQPIAADPRLCRAELRDSEYSCYRGQKTGQAMREDNRVGGRNTRKRGGLTMAAATP